MAKHCCLSRLACWYCYNPVKQQYTIQATSVFFLTTHSSFLPSKGDTSFILHVSFANSFVLTVLVRFNVCLSPLTLLDPFTQGYERVLYFSWLLPPWGSQYSPFRFLPLAQFLPILLQLHFFINCYNAYMYGVGVHDIVRTLPCEILSLPRFIHGCVVFLSSAQSFSIFPDLAHSAFLFTGSGLPYISL